MRPVPGSATLPARPPHRFRALHVALAVALALVAICGAFDWNWCRPLIRHYVMSHSGRSFEFDDMKVHWRHGLDPTIEFRGLRIQNAVWAADKAPFIEAGHLAATLSWRSIGSDKTIIRSMLVEDARIDMERRADGIRNWRLGHPEDRGPPHVRVLELDARNSSGADAAPSGFCNSFILAVYYRTGGESPCSECSRLRNSSVAARASALL